MVFLNVIMLAGLFLLAVFTACAETAFFAVNRYHMKGLAAQGRQRAKLVLALLKRPERILATILLLNTLANVSIAAVATAMVADMVRAPRRNLVLATVTALLTLVLLVFAELTPKSIAVRHADTLALVLIQPLRLFMAIAKPVVDMGSLVALGIARLLGHRDTMELKLTESTLRLLIDESTGDPTSRDRQEMLHGVLSLSDLPVKSVIIPRPEVTAISIDATAEEVFQTLRNSGYSRIPIFREDLDNIVGILHAKDVLPRLLERIQDSSRARSPLELVHVMRKPLFVPDTAKVDATLKYMQKNRIHMAVVIDEHGGMEGIVTLEDLLEQIVGEIQDEHDFELDAIRHLSAGVVQLEADISIREINKRLKINLPESGHYSTVAGFLMSQAGRLLSRGEILLLPPWRFVILETEGRRLVRIRMERVPDEPETLRPSDTQ